MAVAVGALAPAAHATNPSPAGLADLTLTDGTSQVAFPGHPGLALGVDGSDGSWAPDGSRIAFVDSSGDIRVQSATPAGAAPLTLTPPNTAHVLRSHPTWIDGGAAILWSEKATAASPGMLKYALANGADQDSNHVQIVHGYTVPGLAGSFENPDAIVRPVGDLIAFQYTASIPGAKPQIAVIDRSAFSGAAYVVGTGVQPSVSADGTRIAFVQSISNVDQIVSVSSANPGGPAAAPTVITHATAALPRSFAFPVWSQDGLTIVFESLDSSGADYTTLKVAVGSGAESPIVSSGLVTGLPAFQTVRKDTVVRISGAARDDTAIATSKAHWGTAGSGKGVAAKAVVLSRDDQFADALGGSALAAKVGGPLLLTPSAALTPEAQAEIERVLGPGSAAKTVYLLGGTQALSPAVANALTKLNYTVKRLGGTDRFGTAVDIANEITSSSGKAPNYVLTATGMDFADALSAGAAAGAIDANDGQTAVVVLTNTNLMPAETANYLAPLNARTLLQPSDPNYVGLYSVGGQAAKALGSKWVPAPYGHGDFQSLTGTDRYMTSYLVAKQFFEPTAHVGIATGLNWADALSGGALMGTLNGPMLLVDPKAGPQAYGKTWLYDSSGSVSTALIFGGSVAVSPAVDPYVGGLISGPAGFITAVDPSVG